MAIPKQLRGAALIVATVGGSAFAQDPPQGTSDQPTDPVTCPTPNVPPQQTQQQQAQPMYGSEPQPVEAHTGAETWVHDIGVGLAVGGGVEDFSGSTMRNTTSTGGSWTARLTFGTHQYIAGEASYIGSAQSINRLGLSGNSELIGNGAQAALRINGTINYPIQPFLYGGAAWRHYSLNTSGTNFSDVVSSSDAVEIPLGVGVAGYVGNLMLEARGEYRFGWVNHDIVTQSNGGTPLMDRWGVTGNIGYSF
jgi:hypothetical protein